MPFAVILFSTIFGAVCVFTLLFRCLGCRFGISIDRQTTVITKSGNHSQSLGKADNLNRSVISFNCAWILIKF